MIFDPVNITGLMERVFFILRSRSIASSECNPDFIVVMLSIVVLLNESFTRVMQQSFIFPSFISKDVSEID